MHVICDNILLLPMSNYSLAKNLLLKTKSEFTKMGTCGKLAASKGDHLYTFFTYFHYLETKYRSDSSEFIKLVIRITSTKNMLKWFLFLNFGIKN